MFSVFAPLYSFMSIKLALVFLVVLALFLWGFVMLTYIFSLSSSWVSRVSSALFPSVSNYNIMLFSLFIAISLLNLFSLMVYSYPVTTTLSFNLGMALSCWIGGLLIQYMKYKFPSSLLPNNTPWYLVPFLCIVELVSILVRPVTLCFRLLANMTAGHVLIALITKIAFVWPVGSLFGCLELMVCLVQGFVFSMLISVYLDEALHH